MYCYVVDMHEMQVYNILNYVKKFTVQVNKQYITTEHCVIIVDIKEYKTLVKKLATIDFKIMNLVKRCQEITCLQSKLIKE